MKKFIFFIVFFNSLSAFAQTYIHPEMELLDAVTSENINENYDRFVHAYSSLDAKLISETFHEKGTEFYIGFPGKVPIINYGKAAIFINMNKNFVSAHSRNHKLKYIFRLVERKTDGEKIYDVGFYQIYINTGNETFTNYGKFAIVLKEDKDHQWKFLTEINSPATQEEYELSDFFKEINGEQEPFSKK
jgi:hypothetical protein